LAKKNPDIDGADIEEVKKYATVKRWLKGKEPGSVYNYSRAIILFQRSTGKNPDQFLEWARTQDPVNVQDLIDQIADTIPFSGAKFKFKVELRSFLRTNGFNNLPKSRITYTLQDWHRGYRKPEVVSLLGYLDDKLQKLYVYMAVESGLRAKTILAIKWKHIMEDLEAGILPVAIRLGPEFYGKKKSAGFTFLGKRSVELIKDLIKEGVIKPKPETPIVDRSYPVMFKILQKARDKANLDKRIQINHGFRKYFENSLIGIDPDQKDLLEGHFATISSKHYTGREWDDLRPVYAKAYPQIDLNTGDPELVQKLESWQEEKRRLVERFEQERGEWRKELNDLRELVKKEIQDRKKE
jgi:integrase